MWFTRNGPLPDGFPIRTFRVGALAMIALVLVSIGLSYCIEQNIRSAMREQIKVTMATDELEHHGSTLGFAVRAAVTTGDPEAIAEYHASLPAMRRAMAELKRTVAGPEAEQVARRVERADRWLVGEELRAIALVRRGRLREAQKIIDSPAYHESARSYFENLALIEQRADGYVRDTEQQLEFYLLALLGIAGASVLLVGIAWASFVRPARRWGLELQSARARIEASVAELRQSQQDLAHKNRELFRQARVDAVTGLHTRLQLVEDIGNPWASPRDPARQWFALLCDIDRFKLYNQLHGHAAGDKLLRTVADALQAACRPDEQVYRLGGDQMLVLTRAVSFADAVVRGQEFRLAVEQLRHPNDVTAQRLVTIGVGVAGLDGGGELHMEGWLSRAGDALAQAKRASRNAARPQAAKLIRAASGG